MECIAGEDREAIVEDIREKLDEAEDTLAEQTEGMLSVLLYSHRTANRINIQKSCSCEALRLRLTTDELGKRFLVNRQLLTQSMIISEHLAKFYDTLGAFSRCSEVVNDSKMKVGMLRAALLECRSFLQVTLSVAYHFFLRKFSRALDIQ